MTEHLLCSHSITVSNVEIRQKKKNSFRIMSPDCTFFLDNLSLLVISK